jgi:hypothetical protein
MRGLVLLVVTGMWEWIWSSSIRFDIGESHSASPTQIMEF